MIRSPRDIRVDTPQQLKASLEQLWGALQSQLQALRFAALGVLAEQPPSQPIRLEFGKVTKINNTAGAVMQFPRPPANTEENRLFGFCKSGGGTVTFTPQAGVLVNGFSTYSRTGNGLVLCWQDGNDYWTTG